MEEERLAQIEDAIRTLADVLGQLCEKVDWHDQQLDDMNTDGIAARLKGVESDFGSMVNGFTGILSDRKKSRLADMVGAHEGLKSYAPKYAKVWKSDLISDAVESILSQMEQQGIGEEGVPEMLNQLEAELKARLDEEQAEGEGMAHEAAESPVEEKAEHAGGEPEGEKPEGKSVEIEVKTGKLPADILEEARRFRGRSA